MKKAAKKVMKKVIKKPVKAAGKGNFAARMAALKALKGKKAKA